MQSLRPHSDTAKLRPHHHTSYHGLVVVLMLGGMLLSLVTLGALMPTRADSGAIDVNATVSGPPPTIAPVLTAPPDGSTVTTRQVTVSGSCSGNDTIVVMANSVAVGSVFCDHNGQFSLMITLSNGRNVIVAHYVDSLNQSGPDSNALTLTFQPVAGSAPVPLPSTHAKVTNPPVSNTASGLRVSIPTRFDPLPQGGSLTLPPDIEGGTAPYALEIDWGDGTQTLVSRLSAGPSSQAHTYARAGRYLMRVSVSDAAGATAFFQSALQVTGRGVAGSAPTPETPVVIPFGQLEVVWPLFLGLCLVVLSFWLGERYDRRHWQAPPA